MVGALALGQYLVHTGVLTKPIIMRANAAGSHGWRGERERSGLVVREISETEDVRAQRASEMEGPGPRSRVIEPLIRVTGKTTSWASLSSRSDNDLISDLGCSSPVSESGDSVSPLGVFRGCEFAFQKTVVYENGLRFIRRNLGSDHFLERHLESLDLHQPTYANSSDSGMFVEMDKRSDRTIDGNFSLCSDLGIDVNPEEPAYSVPSCVRPLGIEGPIHEGDSSEHSYGESKVKNVFESDSVDNPIYMELEPPGFSREPSEVYSEPPPSKPLKEAPVKGAVVRKAPRPMMRSTAERRMLLSVEKTKEAFEKPSPIRMVYRRHSQRRLQSSKRQERLVPRLSQLCVQVLISQVDQVSHAGYALSEILTVGESSLESTDGEGC